MKEWPRNFPKCLGILIHLLLIPDVLIDEMNANCCEESGAGVPNQTQDSDDDKRKVELATFDRAQLGTLLVRLSSASLPDQKSAAKDLRSLSRRFPSFRSLFGERTEAIAQMLNPLTKGNLDAIDPDLHLDLVTSLLNLSIDRNSKKLVGEHPMVIPVLIASLRCGTVEARSNAAAAVFTLSSLDSNKQIIVEAGGMKPLIDLLQEGNPLAIKDVASAIFKICSKKEMQTRAISDGLIKVILQKIKEALFVDELLVILAIVVKNRHALEELEKLGAVQILLSVVRENSTVERIRENAVLTLHSMCLNDKRMLKEIKDDEKAIETISSITSGNPRAIRKTFEILDRLETT